MLREVPREELRARTATTTTETTSPTVRCCTRRHHTRSTRVVPNSPAGRNSNTSRISPNGTTSSMPLERVDVAGRERVGDADDQPADDRAEHAVEAAERRRREREHEDRLHRRRHEPGCRRDDERARQAADRGGQAPAEHQHPPDRNAEQPARLGIARDAPEREARASCAGAARRAGRTRPRARATSTSVSDEISTPPGRHILCA